MFSFLANGKYTVPPSLATRSLLDVFRKKSPKIDRLEREEDTRPSTVRHRTTPGEGRGRPRQGEGGHIINQALVCLIEEEEKKDGRLEEGSDSRLLPILDRKKCSFFSSVFVISD